MDDDELFLNSILDHGVDDPGDREKALELVKDLEGAQSKLNRNDVLRIMRGPMDLGEASRLCESVIEGMKRPDTEEPIATFDPPVRFPASKLPPGVSGVSEIIADGYQGHIGVDFGPAGRVQNVRCFGDTARYFGGGMYPEKFRAGRYLWAPGLAEMIHPGDNARRVQIPAVPGRRFRLDTRSPEGTIHQFRVAGVWTMHQCNGRRWFVTVVEDCGPVIGPHFAAQMMDVLQVPLDYPYPRHPIDDSFGPAGDRVGKNYALWEHHGWAVAIDGWRQWHLTRAAVDQLRAIDQNETPELL